MASARSLKKWLPLSKKKQSGFTLTELLVAILVGGIITTILLSLVVALLETNQREAARSDTQREVQMALDYMARDLREAVYVYDGNCLVNDAQGTFNSFPLGCQGLLRSLPPRFTTNAGTIPVLAFWKPEKLPDVVQKKCENNAKDLSLPPAQQSGLIKDIPCVSGQMYSLIVYTLEENTTSDTKWRGKARILRYKLPQFSSNGNSVKEWLYPLTEGVGFENWPRNRDGKFLANYPGTPTVTDNSNYQVLLDYVDLDGPKDSSGQVTLDESKLCPQPTPKINPANNGNPQAYQGGYVPTPNVTVSRGRRGFYACVNGGESYGKLNQEIVVRINGNAAGRPGLPRDRSNVPIQMETRVLSRGVVNKSL